MEKVSKGVFNFDSEEWDEVSWEAKDLIRKMLQFEPSKIVINLFKLKAKRYNAY